MRRNPLFFTLFLLIILTISCSRSETYKQPIAYNHKLHVEEADLGCLDCHKGVLTHRKATIPNIDVCIECHEEAMTESKEEEKLVSYISENRQIPWVQVHRVPDHAYFSHRRHVSLGKLGCQECHGNVAGMSLPFSRPAVKIDMEWCLRCHKKNGVDRDCATCHR